MYYIIKKLPPQYRRYSTKFCLTLFLKTAERVTRVQEKSQTLPAAFDCLPERQGFQKLPLQQILPTDNNRRVRATDSRKA